MSRAATRIRAGIARPNIYVDPRGYASGFSTRQRDDMKNDPRYLQLCETAVIDFRHWELYPDGRQNPTIPDPTFLQTLSDAITYCETHTGVYGLPIKVVLRPRVGFWTADWAKTASGGALQYATKDGWGPLAQENPAWKGGQPPSKQGDGETYYFTPGAARWWDNRLWNIYDNMLADLEVFADRILEIDIAYASTQFVEPINHQFYVQENLTTAVDAGWTENLENQAFTRGWTKAKQIFAKHGVGIATSYNPAPTITFPGGVPKYNPGQNLTRTTSLMQQQISLLGPFALIQNKSFDANFIGGNRDETKKDDGTAAPPIGNQAAYERQMWDYMATLNAQTPEQTSTLAKHISDGLTVKQTIAALVQFKGMRCELPNGCQDSTQPDPGNYISPSYAQTYSQQIKYHPERA